MKLIPLSGNEAYAINQTNLVVGSSLIYDEHFSAAFHLNPFDPTTEYLSEEVAKRISRVPERSAADFEFNFTTQPNSTLQISGTSVPFNLIHPYNYFHFLIEALPSLLALIRAQFIAPDHIIISGILHANMLHAFKIATDNRFQLAELNLLTAVKSSKTIVAKDSFVGNEPISGKMLENFHYTDANLLALRELFEQRLPMRAPAQLKVFIVRRSGQRNILNNDALIAAAQGQGFIVIEPEKFTFTQQVDLFRSASIIVGPTGAWLANLLFVRAGVKVKVLYPHTCKASVSFWWKLGSIFDVAVTEHYFEALKVNPYQPIHSDFTVDLPTFNRLLNE